MKQSELSQIFHVEYGNKFDLNKMTPATGSDAVAFVGRSRENNGVTSAVMHSDGVSPYDAGLITVALGGSYLLSSHVQLKPFYTAQNIAVLRPLEPMSLSVKLYYCKSIEANRFKYSAFGREANRTLKSLKVPSLESVPEWAKKAKQPNFDGRIARLVPTSLEIKIGGLVPLKDVFDVRYGTNHELNRMLLKPNGVAFVSRTSKNNGVSARVELMADPPTPAGCLTVALGGSVLETFYQDEPSYQGRDVNVLVPKEDISVGEMLWYCAAIRQHQFRFSFGRQANRSLQDLNIPLAPKSFKKILERV